MGRLEITLFPEFAPPTFLGERRQFLLAEVEDGLAERPLVVRQPRARVVDGVVAQAPPCEMRELIVRQSRYQGGPWDWVLSGYRVRRSSGAQEQTSTRGRWRQNSKLPYTALAGF